MKPANQRQHKIPRVYLKKFGYQNRNNQWMVSVVKKGENNSRQKSIASFTVATNIFDVESDDPRIPRMFEQLNGNLETEYNNIVSDLETNERLTNKSYAYLLQLIANLIVRSDDWRERILFILNSDVKENFLKIILGHHCKDEAEFGRIQELEFYRGLADLPPEQSINRVLIYFIDHLMLRLWRYEITFIKSQEDKPWYTSTNPVVVHNRVSRLEMLAKESEIYFPVSPQYLAYLHYKGSDDQENILRSYETNTVHLATDEQNESLQHIILENVLEYMIFAGEAHLRNGEAA
jgi:hypothetical protein